jgi:hypothetical protein
MTKANRNIMLSSMGALTPGRDTVNNPDMMMVSVEGASEGTKDADGAELGRILSVGALLGLADSEGL